MKKIFLMLIIMLTALPIIKADGITNEQETTNEIVENNESAKDEEKENAETEDDEDDEEDKEGLNQSASGIISINGESAIIMEAQTHKVLFEKNSDVPLAPASMTKIMTMLLVMESLEKGNITLNDQVTISENAASMGGSQVYLEKGSVATVKELLTAVAIASANDVVISKKQIVK